MFQSVEETIDKEIINHTIIDDKRRDQINERNYMNESYNIYRLELSLYLNNNLDIKETIINIVKNPKISSKSKKFELRKFSSQ